MQKLTADQQTNILCETVLCLSALNASWGMLTTKENARFLRLRVRIVSYAVETCPGFTKTKFLKDPTLISQLPLFVI